MTKRPSEQELNAFIDGELSPQDTARIARAIALDPSVAARVAALARVKTVLGGLGEDLYGSPSSTHSRRQTRWLGMAAVAGLLLATAMVMLITFAIFSSPDDRWYHVALAEHWAWAFEPALPDALEVDPNLFLASVEQFGLPVQAPDLSSAGLRLTYMQYHAPAGEHVAALHLGYTGRHGCKLTLWVSAAPNDLSTALVESRLDKLRAFRWRSGKTAYALLATGMAERRFTLIAAKVYQATQRHDGFDDDTRLALKNESANAPPCQA